MRTGASSTSRRRGGTTWLRLPIALFTIVGLIALGGCGSSKPAYCSSRSSLENSIKGLTSLNLSSGLSGLQAQLQKIQGDAKALVSSAKSDFPSQTSAITSSLDSLTGAVKSIPSSPSAAQIAAIASNAATVVNSVKSFTDATSSKCS
jgi:hypothetical protein